MLLGLLNNEEAQQSDDDLFLNTVDAAEQTDGEALLNSEGTAQQTTVNFQNMFEMYLIEKSNANEDELDGIQEVSKFQIYIIRPRKWNIKRYIEIVLY